MAILREPILHRFDLLHQTRDLFLHVLHQNGLLLQRLF